MIPGKAGHSPVVVKCVDVVVEGHVAVKAIGRKVRVRAEGKEPRWISLDQADVSTVVPSQVLPLPPGVC